MIRRAKTVTGYDSTAAFMALYWAMARPDTALATLTGHSTYLECSGILPKSGRAARIRLSTSNVHGRFNLMADTDSLESMCEIFEICKGPEGYFVANWTESTIWA